MVVTAERTGGLGGWHERLGPVDTSEAATGEQIERAVADADFFNLPADFPPKQQVRDGYRYSLSVSDGDDKAHVVSFETGSETPDGVRQILRAVDTAADWEQVS